MSRSLNHSMDGREQTGMSNLLPGEGLRVNEVTEMKLVKDGMSLPVF